MEPICYITLISYNLRIYTKGFWDVLVAMTGYHTLRQGCQHNELIYKIKYFCFLDGTKVLLRKCALIKNYLYLLDVRQYALNKYMYCEYIWCYRGCCAGRASLVHRACASTTVFLYQGSKIMQSALELSLINTHIDAIYNYYLTCPS